MPKSKSTRKSKGKTKSSTRRKPFDKDEALRKEKRKTLGNKLQEVYASVDLETTCCRQCVCCLTACPQMGYSEAVQILDQIWSKWTMEDKKKLVAKSVRYFFSNQVVKACPMLGRLEDGKYGCRVYEDRPLNCRVYGLWPSDTYDKRVDGFVDATGMEAKEIPLNRQCQHVRLKNGGELTDEIIDELYGKIDAIDIQISQFTAAEIEKNYNKRTIHDWVMAKVFGEEKLALLTQFFQAANEKEVGDFVEKMVEQVGTMEIKDV